MSERLNETQQDVNGRLTLVHEIRSFPSRKEKMEYKVSLLFIFKFGFEN